MNTVVEEIKQKIDIVDYIGQYVELKRAGRNFKAICPFHDEKSPSFVVSPDRQIWHCFGSCGTGGDVISFCMKWERLTFPEALRMMAEKAGVVLDVSTYSDSEMKLKDELQAVNLLALKFYQHVLLHTPVGAQARKYLEERGLREKIIRTFEIGYAPSSWDSLIRFLHDKKHIPMEKLLQAGLVIEPSPGKRPYDRFRNRIIFPIKDTKGAIVAFSGRVLNPDEKSAKYINSPETELYHKRESLFGIHLTKDAIAKANMVLIVEGEFDLITPYMHGIDTIVAIKGAALTREQLEILKRYTKNIILALDNDEAGVEAMKRGIREAEKLDFDIHVLKLSGGKDPDEAVRHDAALFKKDLKQSMPVYDFLLEHFASKNPGNSPFEKKNIAVEMAPYIGHIQNPIVFSHYVKKIAHLLEVDDESVVKLITQEKRKEKRTPYTKQKEKSQSTLSRIEMLQKYLLSSVFQSDTLYEHACIVQDAIPAKEYTVPAYGNLMQALEGYVRLKERSATYEDFVSQLAPQLQSVADELYLYASAEVPASERNISQLIYDFKKLNYQRLVSEYSKEESEEAVQKASYYSQKLQDLPKHP